ncbi:unnamed protein product [Miscanthus lutarioriparius]|uniref:Uncharacterized protein n=1 Tax=Miscanthus lutarioriparius TaxID=422564 RepID=A0A811RA48_9POAL|nr:unnamed protein product [Miscanthus lutarioriparius]
MASHLLLLATLALLFIAAAGQEGNKIMKLFNPSYSTTDNYTDGSQYKKNRTHKISSTHKISTDYAV